MSTYGGPPDSGPVSEPSLLPELQAVLSGFRASVQAQVSAGERLGELVRDQVADGQVETLSLLEAGAHGLRRESQRLTELASGLEQRLIAAEARLGALVDSGVNRIGEAIAAGGAHLAGAADQAVARLGAELADVERQRGEAAADLTRLAQQRQDALDRETAALTARFAETEMAAQRRDARHEQALEQAVTAATQGVAEALTGLTQRAVEGAERIDASTEAAVQR